MRNSDPDYIWLHIFVSGLYLIIGLYLWISPPKDMDKPTGFNIPTSTKVKLNIDVWTAFHKHLGKIIATISFMLLVLIVCINLTISVEQFSSTQLEGLNIALLMMTSPFILFTSIIITETHMTKTFDKKGNRKKNDLNA